MKTELIATATFGLEAVVKREIEALGYRILKSENGKITFQGDERAIVRSNLWLRAADRVLLKMAEFRAEEFEELFQQIKGIPWEELIPPDGRIIVTGSSVKSKLHSVPACQSIANKAVIKRLSEAYGIEEFEETGAEYSIKLTLLKDLVTVTVDTTGKGLHKRAYRILGTEAPLKETLAAALVMLSFWKEGRMLADPLCGSGTIPIEAAMIGKNIAPGLNRNFVSEGWHIIEESTWKEERKRAFGLIKNDADIRIEASDISETAIQAAVENAKEAGVDDVISFKRKDIADFDTEEKKCIIITNPPYGRRIGSKEDIDRIYKVLKKLLEKNKGWSLFIVTADKNAEKAIKGRPADKRRKLYNGRLEVCYYQFHGEK